MKCEYKIFKSKLANIDWTSTKNASDTNAMYDLFIAKYTGLFDSCFPFRIIKGKALNSFRKPWITKGLLKSINKKNKLYKNYICNRSNPQLVKYKTYKNKLTLLLRTAKKRYYEMQLDKSNENIKQTWRILNVTSIETKERHHQHCSYMITAEIYPTQK